MMDAVRIQKVSKRFGGLMALDGVDLTVPTGATFGLIGPNGAGKTTLFGLVCGWLWPTDGALTVLGSPKWSVARLKGRLAALPQDAALPPHISVFRSLVFYGRLQGLSKKEARAEAERTLAMAGLSEAANMRASHLSHGMAKKAGLAQAFIGAPELILLDEPTAGLDPKSAHQVREMIRELRGKATVLVSSHNLHELEAICDHAAVLDRGKLIAGGTMSELTAADTEVLITLANTQAELERLAKAAGAVAGVASAGLDAASSTLTVRFTTAGEPPEEVVTRVLFALISGGGKIGSVSRGQGLERRVLSMT